MRVLIIALVTTVLAACAEPDPEPTTDEEQAFRLLQEAAEDFPALNATVIVDGKIVWEATAGELVAEDDGPEANYNVYSTAKMMTGMAFAKLAHSQAVAVDQSIHEIDPELPDHLQGVTLRQLMAHTAGIRGYTSDEDWDSFATLKCRIPADALPHFIDDPLVTEPGETYKYTTYGFVLMSHLLVEITGAADYDSAMRSVLGDLYVATTDNDDIAKATNYGNALFGFKVLDDINAQCKFGAGGLVTSARSLAQMGTALYQGDVVDTEALSALLQPTPTTNGEDSSYTFGMGVGAVEDMQPPSRYAAHSGGSPGGRSYLLVLFEPRIAVGMSTNFDGPNLGKTAFAIARAFATGQDKESLDGET